MAGIGQIGTEGGAGWTEEIWVVIFTAAVAVGICAAPIRHEEVLKSLTETVTGQASSSSSSSSRSSSSSSDSGDRSGGGDSSRDRSGGGLAGLAGGHILLPPTAGQSLVKLQRRHAGHDPAPAMPALAEVRVTVVLLKVAVLLAYLVPGAGVPLGGGGGGGGAHPALRHLPGLGALLVLLAPDPRLPAVSVETEAQKALAPLLATTGTGAA